VPDGLCCAAINPLSTTSRHFEELHSIEQLQLLQVCHNGTHIFCRHPGYHALTSSGLHTGHQLPRTTITQSSSFSLSSPSTINQHLQTPSLSAYPANTSSPEISRDVLRDWPPTLLPHPRKILHLPPRNSRFPLQQDRHSAYGRVIGDADRE
jgi:hypothetical protein